MIPASSAEAIGKDPVCGMNVSEKSISLEHEGKTYRFCSKGCLEKFRADPARYLKSQTQLLKLESLVQKTAPAQAQTSPGSHRGLAVIPSDPPAGLAASPTAR